MGKRAIAAALLLACSPAVHAEGTQPSVAVYYPGMSWVLRYDLEGVLEDYNNHKTGVSTYATARSETNGMLASAQMHAAQAARGARDCREREHQHVRQQKPLANAKIRLSETAGVDMEVVIPLGEAVSRHVHRFWLRDGVCAKLHVSKTPFTEADRAAFDKVMDSARFEAAGEALERAFVVPGRGTLVVSMPAAWGFRAGKPGRMAPRELQFMDPAGAYQLAITLFPESQKLLKGGPTRAFVQMARDMVKPNAVEPDPALVSLKGGAGDGVYFLVTDKDLVGKPDKPNDWKYLRQGALTLGESLLFFSLFSNVKESPLVDVVLRSVGEARLNPEK
jgi:hypothetical protein